MRLGIAPGLAAAFAKGDQLTVERLYNLSARCATLLSWPVFWVLLVFAGPALGWFGDEFTSGRAALGVLAVAMMVNVAFGNVVTVLLMSGHSQWATRNTVCALVVTIGVDVALVPEWGATGAAIGWLAGVITENALGMWRLWQLGVRPDLSGLGLVGGSVSLVCLASASLGFAVAGMTTAGLAVAALASVAGTIGIGWLLRRRLELDLLRNRGQA